MGGRWIGADRGQSPNRAGSVRDCQRTMPRAARVVAVGAPHHLTQRGNNRQDVFLVDDDRRAYLERLRQDCRARGGRVLDYCLMSNHVHLIAVPGRADSFARALRRAHSSYAQAFNREYRRGGHLWQNRFFSCALAADHVPAALLYVDLNPVRAGLVGGDAGYPWSSAAWRANGSEDALLDKEAWSEVRETGAWGEALRRGPGAWFEEELREATRTGLPLGDERFVAELEQRSGRRLRAAKPGPKPRAVGAGAGGK
ncbi:MAG: transposase [Acidobacteria bacterium]|nr:transposase [Acidobacteriota bacterium]